MRLNIVRSLLVPFLCCFTVPALSQNDSLVPQPTGRNEGLLQCAEWTRAKASLDTVQDLDNLLKAQHNESAADDPVRVAETVKLPYLKGLQYGYLTAFQDVYPMLKRDSGEDPDK